VNAFREDFQDCIRNNGNSAQRAQQPYEDRTLRMRKDLAEFANDVRNIMSQNRANLAKFRADLARNIAEAFRGFDLSTVGAGSFRDVFLWTLRKTVEPFSMRALASRFAANSTHEELKNADFLPAYVDDFNGRVARLPTGSIPLPATFWRWV